MDNSNIDTHLAKSYSDFSGLAELRGQVQKNSDKAIKETAKQFESVFIGMMIKSMRDASIKDPKSNSNALETFQGMFDKEVSVQMANRDGIGLAKFITQAVQQKKLNTTASDFFKTRQQLPIALHPQATPMNLNSSVQPSFEIQREALKPLNTKMINPIDGSNL